MAPALADLGNAFRQLGDARKAAKFLTRSLAIVERVYGPEHAEVARTLSHLGYAYMELGDARAAAAFRERALAIQERAFGPERAALAPALGHTLETFRPPSAEIVDYISLQWAEIPATDVLVRAPSPVEVEGHWAASPPWLSGLWGELLPADGWPSDSS